MLELIIVIERRGRHIEDRRIKIGFDNRKHYQQLRSSTKKSNICTQEAGAEIIMIKYSNKEYQI